MQGYFIRIGDKTSCGGKVIEGSSGTIMGGLPQSRLGDTVTCGVTGGFFQIVGGVPWILSDGLPVAGTLDSFSSCPCNASLCHSYQHADYKTTSVQGPSSTTAQPTNLTAGENHTAPLQFATPRNPESFSGCFQLLNQHAQPCASHSCVLLRDGRYLSPHRLDNEGRSQIIDATAPTRTQIATTAPSPVLE
ncbi:PAAR domain-containing protein [Pseudomonas huaxiensis]|uniref:PAAR domain-containing protein n=1 Tax=Pseudomonas huaxiensis TaxID=2213017 RepID=UPI000DA6D066|nr:PAAR domain-containing protein [Pseudomonas huaxiensis]